MDIFYGIVFLVYGLVLGSFLNVCICRIPKGISVATGRSRCPRCDHELGWKDLVPVFSRMATHGKCRYCGGEISPVYSVVELLTGLLFLFSYLRFGISGMSVLTCALVCVLITMAFIDINTGEIPDRIHLFLLGLGLMRLVVVEWNGWQSCLAGMAVVSVPMLLLAYVTKGFGGGDIKLMASAGLFLGMWQTVAAFFVGAVLGALYGTALMIFKKASGKTAIAFGPFLGVGILVSAFYFEVLAKWYTDTFFGFL